MFKFNPKIEKYINEEKNVMTNKFTFLGVIGNSSIDLNLIVVLNKIIKKRKKKIQWTTNKLLSALNVNNVKTGINDTTIKKIFKKLDKKSLFILIIRP